MPSYAFSGSVGSYVSFSYELTSYRVENKFKQVEQPMLALVWRTCKNRFAVSAGGCIVKENQRPRFSSIAASICWAYSKRPTPS